MFIRTKSAVLASLELPVHTVDSPWGLVSVDLFSFGWSVVQSRSHRACHPGGSGKSRHSSFYYLIIGHFKVADTLKRLLILLKFSYRLYISNQNITSLANFQLKFLKSKISIKIILYKIRSL